MTINDDLAVVVHPVRIRPPHNGLYDAPVPGPRMRRLRMRVVKPFGRGLPADLLRVSLCDRNPEVMPGLSRSFSRGRWRRDPRRRPLGPGLRCPRQPGEQLRLHGRRDREAYRSVLRGGGAEGGPGDHRREVTANSPWARRHDRRDDDPPLPVPRRLADHEGSGRIWRDDQRLSGDAGGVDRRPRPQQRRLPGGSGASPSEGLGTGVGGMAAGESAGQMRAAYDMIVGGAGSTSYTPPRPPS